MTERTYKIDELARAAGMSVRTVRYYVQRGLLPAPAFRGKDTAYAREHLVRLRAIRRLQDAFFPLDAIAVELGGRSLVELERIADGKVMPVSPSPERALPSAPSPDGARTGTGEGVTILRGADGEADARAAVAREASRVFRRVELFPGVDLTVADDAPDKSVKLVKEMLAILEAMLKGKEGDRSR